MKRAITANDVAFAYEIRQEYKWHWKKIAKFIGCNKGNLIHYVKQFEQNGIRWGFNYD